MKSNKFVPDHWTQSLPVEVAWLACAEVAEGGEVAEGRYLSMSLLSF